MRANLDLVRSIYAAFERGDWISIEWAHPEIELVIADGPSPGTWAGLADVASAWRDFLSTWEDPRSEPEEYRELDGERVLVLEHYSGRGKTSGVEIGQMDFPRFRGHLSAWVERPGQGGSSAQNKATVSTGVPS